MTTNPGSPAAFFDLDKTIIARSSTLAFSRSFYQGGLISRTSVLRSAYAQLVFHFGGADHDQIERMRRYLTSQAAGWDVSTVKAIVAETLHNIVDPLVYDEAVELIERHHRKGHDVVIVSTSGSEVVEPIGHMLGVDHVIATQMVQDAGRYTGEIKFYAYAVNKATAIAEMADREGYDLSGSFAYSDSATDLPMLEVVGHPIAVNPDKQLRKIAVEREWPVLDFVKPVQLRKRVHFEPTRATVTAVVLGAGGAALAGAAALVARRYRGSVALRTREHCRSIATPTRRAAREHSRSIATPTRRAAQVFPFRQERRTKETAQRTSQVPTRRSTLLEGVSPRSTEAT